MEQHYYYSALVFGSLGGFIPLLLLLALKKTAPSIETYPRDKQLGRFAWFLAKLAVSVIVTVAATFWFMDDAIAKTMSASKMYFVQMMTGIAPTSVLALLQAKFGNYFK